MADIANSVFIATCKDCDTTFYSKSTFSHHQGICEETLRRLEIEMLKADPNERLRMLLAMMPPHMVRMQACLADDDWKQLFSTMSQADKVHVFTTVTLEGSVAQISRWQDSTSDEEWVSETGADTCLMSFVTDRIA